MSHRLPWFGKLKGKETGQFILVEARRIIIPERTLLFQLRAGGFWELAHLLETNLVFETADAYYFFLGPETAFYSLKSKDMKSDELYF